MTNRTNNSIVFLFWISAMLGVNQCVFSQDLYVYQDGYSHWLPSGWMPDGNGISVNPNSTQNPYRGSSCIELKFALKGLSQGWAGVYWLTHDSWKGPGVNIYRELGVPNGTPVRLTFRVRGAAGGERVQFKVGGISDGNDSVEFAVATSWITISESSWSNVPIEINLADQDLSNVVGGFCVVTNKARNPTKDFITLYLDDIKYEVIR